MYYSIKLLKKNIIPLINSTLIPFIQYFGQATKTLKTKNHPVQYNSKYASFQISMDFAFVFLTSDKCWQCHFKS